MTSYRPFGTALNGFSSLTESARLRKKINQATYCAQKPLGIPTYCPVIYPTTIQAPITPAQSSRLLPLSYGCGGVIGGGGVSQERAQKLLEEAAFGKHFDSETSRTNQLIQDTISSSTSTPFTQPIILLQCPPLPAPPAPPAKIKCI